MILVKGTYQQDKEGEMAGKFVLYQDKSGEFRFRLKVGNGENIGVSQGYKTNPGKRVRRMHLIQT
jgi:hypothetical protein